MSNMDFPGPSAPWVEDGAELPYNDVLDEAARFLARSLLRRVAALDDVDISIDALIQETKRQIAEAAVDGRLDLLQDLGDMAFRLLLERENRLLRERENRP